MSDYLMKTLKFKDGGRLEIIREMDISDYCPRLNDNFGTMLFGHKQYYLGDTKFHTKEELEKVMNDSNNVFLKVWMYEHSGITISTEYTYPYNDYWDAGLLGIIYVSKDKIRETFRVKHITKKVMDLVLDSLRGEVKEYDMYLTENVYGFRYYDSNGDEVENGWGYIGYVDDLTTFFMNDIGINPDDIEEEIE